MRTIPSLGQVFTALAVIFLALAVRDYLQAEGKMTAARQTWLRMAFIFAGISIILYAVQILFR
ncbi:MAG: hypothetical protein V7641_1838 [Blastocatellia bacterium]